MSKNVCKYAIRINEKSFPINSEKLLIGSGKNADILIEENSVSFYHSMIFADQSGKIVVLDLDSLNGTFINGVKIGAKTSIFEGDTLTIGKIHCSIEEVLEPIDFTFQDQSTQVFEDLQQNKVYIPQQVNENEVLIDDEYCDIVFDDKSFVPSFENPLKNIKVDDKNYIDTEYFERPFEILNETEGHCLQVTTILNGRLIEQYYYPLKDGVINASSRSKRKNIMIDVLPDKFEAPFVKMQNGVIEVIDLEGFSASHKSMNMTDQDVIVITRGTYQIFIEIASAPHKLAHISSLRRDRAFYQETATKFAAVILPMLLLLLVDFTIEKKKPLKQLSIIYKKPTKANVDNKKMASENPNNTVKDTGHKSEKQPDKKIAHSKAGKKAPPKKAPKKALAKASKPTPQKKVKAKMKAYKFKMATNVNSMFSNTKSASVSNSKSVSNIKTTSNVSGSLNTKVNGTTSSQVGKMGSDSSGRSVASYGSKGLSSKAGRNTAYIQTKTVVLGSMDPELLRKILQQYLPQFRHCYQQELAYNSEDIKGIVDLNFEISGKGKVGKIKVRAKDSRFSKKGLNCMAKVLAVIDFPKPKGGGRVAVRQPLSFFSEKEKG